MIGMSGGALIEVSVKEADVEEWRDVAGFVGFYQVSNLGRIRSLDRTVEFVQGGKHKKRFFAGRVLRPSRSGKGTNSWDISLCHGEGGGERQRKGMGPLVWETFVGPVPKGLWVTHIDGNRANNALYNLQLEHPADNFPHRNFPEGHWARIQKQFNDKKGKGK